MKMVEGSSSVQHHLSQLLLLFSLAYLVAGAAAGAAATQPVAAARHGRRSMPGFLFARSRASISRCTPQFWSSRSEGWPRMAPPRSTVLKVFGSRARERFRPDLTLLEATARNDDVWDAYAALLKEATAALLSCYARRQGFPYTAWEVKTLLIQALVSDDAAALQAHRFSVANKACV